MTGADLSAAISTFAREIPVDQVEETARFLEQPGMSPAAGDRLVSLIPNQRFRGLATALISAWTTEPDVPACSLALALRAAIAAVAGERSVEKVELVWTGPASTGVPLRFTHGVLIDLIQGATSELTIVSFAAYKVGEVCDAIRDATARGVRTRLVLDGGTDAHQAFTALGDSVEVFTWPPTLLPRSDPDHASLHAKVAVADAKTAFVTSANLTGYALDRNMELGVLVTGGRLPSQLAGQFDGLIASGDLAPWRPARS